MGNFEAIVQDADRQIALMQELERSLNAQINSIKDEEFAGPLPKSRRLELQQLREVKAALLATMEELAFVTVGTLDKTPEVKRLANAIQGARRTLEEELSDIKHIEVVAKTATKILGGISDVQAKLSKLAENA